MDLIVICAICVVLILILIYYFKEKPRCKFPSYDEFRDRVSKSKFFASLSEYDVSYRNADTKEEYYLRYLNAYKDMTKCQMSRITRLYNKLELPDCLKITCDVVYLRHTLPVEFGLPHTQEGMIMLQKKDFDADDTTLSNTLVHELIHIYQYYNKDHTINFLKRLGFHLADKNMTGVLNSISDYNYVANPDVPVIDGEPIVFYFNYTPTSYSQYIPSNNMYIGKRFMLKQIYKDNVGEITMTDVGIDSTGESIVNINFDSSLHQQGHPYEIMAEVMVKYINNDVIRRDWMEIIEDSDFSY